MMKNSKFKKVALALSLGLGLSGAFSATANDPYPDGNCTIYIEECKAGDFFACSLARKFCDYRPIP